MIERTPGPVECRGNEQALVETRRTLLQASELSATSKFPRRPDHERIPSTYKDSRPPEVVPSCDDEKLAATDARDRAIAGPGRAVTDDPAEDITGNPSSDSASDQPSPERTSGSGEACAGTEGQEPGIIPDSGGDVAADAGEEVTESLVRGGPSGESSPELSVVVDQADEEGGDDGGSSEEGAAAAAALGAEEIEEFLPRGPIGEPVAEVDIEANKRMTKETDDPTPQPSYVHLNLPRKDEVEPRGQARLAHGQAPIGSLTDPARECLATVQNQPSWMEKLNRSFAEPAPATESRDRPSVSHKDYLSRKTEAARPFEASTISESDLVSDPKSCELDPVLSQPKDIELQRARSQKNHSVGKSKSRVEPTLRGAPKVDKPFGVKTTKDFLTVTTPASAPVHPPLDQKLAAPESTPVASPQHGVFDGSSSKKPAARQPEPTSAWGSGGEASAVKPDYSKGVWKNGTGTRPNEPASPRRRSPRPERELAMASIRRLVEGAINCILVAHGFSPGLLVTMASKLVARVLVGRPSVAERVLGLAIGLGRLLEELRKMGGIDVKSRYSSPTGLSAHAADVRDESTPSISHRDPSLDQEWDNAPKDPPTINAESHQERNTLSEDPPSINAGSNEEWGAASEDPPSINAGSDIDDPFDSGESDRRRRGPEM